MVPKINYSDDKRINKPSLLLCDEIGYNSFDKPNSYLFLKKWYERKNSPNFVMRKQTCIKSIIVIDFCNEHFIPNNKSAVPIMFNKKCIEYVRKVILINTPFSTVEDFVDYTKGIQVKRCLYDPYVDLVFNAIRMMSDFSRWLKAKNYRIRMR